MKRTVNGVTYDTDASDLVARWKRHYPASFGRAEETALQVLYQAPNKAFFVHHAMQTVCRMGDTTDRHEFEYFTREQAAHWVTKSGVELLLAEAVDAVPEARTFVAEPMTTLYISVPQSLKMRAEKIAASQGLSLAAWTSRRFELWFEESTETAAIPCSVRSGD